jgi:hypothetical protein
MRQIISILCFCISIILFSTVVLAKDVHVKGYYRKDGTYVRPHIRSSPDSSKANNYGPSQSSDELMNPRTRDYDHDGIPNYLDSDSDNDGIHDDADSNPYGGSNSGYSDKSKNTSSSTTQKQHSNIDNKKRDNSSSNETRKESNEFIVYFKNGKKLICEKAWLDGKKVYLVVQNKKFAVGYQKDEIDMKKSFK